ncbi:MULTISPECIES: Fur family transcriptional regulator [Microbacterium]|uniref:Zinc uptake regulation protein ZUR n=1 Tax=Microbacterium esteraromaticum TaxID=57043 RepID=A0A1R4IFX4_9MICO|nr:MULTISPECIES: transcriptional repressor [Microbacterium]RCS61271.1 transcriptional repressor [Microbacterium sp. JB110]SJM51307.1 Zinc uptake regulation protein ZUR [Frigoribacterium sp. JB110]SJN18705.1 Zinc uptake regulation protein ZUR [Microbacterium esteraromaticum]HCS60205.1 transcriptional repressor [Microbacterium sp.]
MNAAIRERRQTVQKEAVRQALEEATGFISATQLHQRINTEGTPIGLATVYRQLNALAESGHADTIPVPSGQLFRACEPGAHHHHLVCEECGTAVEIEPSDEEWIRDTAARHGFTVTRHILEVFGRCADCAAA